MTDAPQHPPPADAGADLGRWRLILGRFAEPCLGAAGGAGSKQCRMDRVLDYLYGREYRGRGVRGGVGQGKGAAGRDGESESREGGDAESVLAVPEWIQQVRELFPADTAEIIQKHALDRYGMTELVTDAEVLKKLEPNYELLKAILSFKGMMQGEVLETARKIVRHVVEELRRKLAKEVRRALWGRLNKQRRSRLKVLRNLDWRRTIRANLKNYDKERMLSDIVAIGKGRFAQRLASNIKDKACPKYILNAFDYVATRCR